MNITQILLRRVITRVVEAGVVTGQYSIFTIPTQNIVITRLTALTSALCHYYAGPNSPPQSLDFLPSSIFGTSQNLL